MTEWLDEWMNEWYFYQFIDDGTHVLLEGLGEEERRRRKESKGRGEDVKVKERCCNIYSVTNPEVW